eukprot:1621935-Pleurochrysis_carterae.AAC.2
MTCCLHASERSSFTAANPARENTRSPRRDCLPARACARGSACTAAGRGRACSPSDCRARCRPSAPPGSPSSI